jgi:hypothetical protein
MSALPALSPHGDVEAQVRAIDVAIDRLVEMSADELIDATDKAAQFRKIAQAMKCNDRVMHRCILFEIHALRAVARIGATEMLPQHQRRPAKDLLNEEVFQSVIGLASKKTTAIAAYRAYKQMVEDAELAEMGEDWRSGRNRPTPTYDDLDRQQIRNAAALLLDRIDATERARPLTINQLAESLRNELHWAKPWSTAEGELVKDVIRDALVEDATVGDDSEEAHIDGLPRYVTYYHEEAWYRVPVQSATVQQLQWMLSYRRQQIAEMEKKASELASAIDELLVIQARRPDAQLVCDLMRTLAQPKYRRQAVAS